MTVNVSRSSCTITRQVTLGTGQGIEIILPEIGVNPKFTSNETFKAKGKYMWVHSNGNVLKYTFANFSIIGKPVSMFESELLAATDCLAEEMSPAAEKG